MRHKDIVVEEHDDDVRCQTGSRNKAFSTPTLNDGVGYNGLGYGADTAFHRMNQFLVIVTIWPHIRGKQTSKK